MIKKTVRLSVIALLLITSSAFAGSYTINVSDGFGTGPFAYVVLTDNGPNSVNVAVNMEPDYGLMSPGGNQAFGFNLTDNNVVLSITNISGPFTYSGTAPGGNEWNFGYVGKYEYAFSGPGAPGVAGSDALTFTVKATSGTLTLASFEEKAVNPPGSVGGYFGLHIWSATAPSNANTFPATNQVPEPTTILLLGLGLIGLAGIRRKLQMRVER